MSRIDNSKILIGILFSFILIFPLVVQAAGPETPVGGDWLVRHIGAEPATLNPVTATDVYESTIDGYVYESQRFENVKVYPLGLNPAEWWVEEKRQLYR
ncbi:hypothetical protein MUP29_05005 [bacterium]|nr:hypothetical protein [bacterium]